MLIIALFAVGCLPKELGDLVSLAVLDVSRNRLAGQLSIRSERLNGSLTCNLVCACTGELPLEIIRMKAKGVNVSLYNNAGFTLPSNIGELGGDIRKLDLSNCSLKGPCSTRSERIVSFINMCIGTLHTGGVSNDMFGFLCRLEHFDLGGNPGLDQSTLAGYLACTQKNLKDATRIDARDKGLKGEGSASGLSTPTDLVDFVQLGVCAKASCPSRLFA